MVGVNRSGGGGGNVMPSITSNGTGPGTAAGDVLTIRMPNGVEASTYSWWIDRGAGYVTLSNTTATYEVQPADIPPPGDFWPIIGRAGPDLNLVSRLFTVVNPAVTNINSSSILGDSIDAYGDMAVSGTTGGQTSLSHIGIINDIERLAGREGFEIIGFHAVGGTTAKQCLATQVPAAIASPSRLAIVHTGVNDYNNTLTAGQGGPYTQASILADVYEIIDELAQAKDWVFIDAIHPVSQSGTTGAKGRATEFPAHNAAVAAKCAEYPNVTYCDGYSIFIDPGSGQLNPLPNLIQTVDGIHQTTYGARTWGEGIRSAMLSGIALLPYRTRSANILLPFGTTGGTATPGTGSVTGTANIPLGYNVQVVSGSASVVVTADATSVTLTITNAGGVASTVYLQYSQTANLLAAVSAGDTLQCGIDFEVTNAVNLTRVAVTQRENTGSLTLWNAMARDATLETDAVLKYNQADQTGRRWTHPRTIGTLTGLEYLVAVNVGAAGSVTIKYSNPTFHKLLAA